MSATELVLSVFAFYYSVRHHHGLGVGYQVLYNKLSSAKLRKVAANCTNWNEDLAVAHVWPLSLVQSLADQSLYFPSLFDKHFPVSEKGPVGLLLTHMQNGPWRIKLGSVHGFRNKDTVIETFQWGKDNVEFGVVRWQVAIKMPNRHHPDDLPHCDVTRLP